MSPSEEHRADDSGHKTDGPDTGGEHTHILKRHVELLDVCLGALILVLVTLGSALFSYHYTLPGAEFGVAAIFVVSLWIYVYYRHRYSRRRVFQWPPFMVAGVAVVVLASHGTYRWWDDFTHPPDSDTQGWLVPRSATASSDGFRVLLGTIALGAANSESHIPIIAVAGEPLLWARCIHDHVAISGRFFDDDGLVAKVVDNEFVSNRGALALVRPDPSTLILNDKWDEPIARIDYIDRGTLRVKGRFRHRRNDMILVVNDNGVFREDPQTHALDNLFGGGWYMAGGHMSANGFELGSDDQNR